MAAKKISSRTVSREAYHLRWKNALDRRAGMERELAVRAFDPALVLAVQAAIAACDAFTIFHRGERSASERHLDAVEVLSHVPDIPGLKEGSGFLRDLLREKANIEYSGKPIRPEKAEHLTEKARRFIDFVGRHLPGPPA